jgi:hypothetical protein
MEHDEHARSRKRQEEMAIPRKPSYCDKMRLSCEDAKLHA